jgi:hypothetical protein
LTVFVFVFVIVVTVDSFVIVLVTVFLAVLVLVNVVVVKIKWVDVGVVTIQEHPSEIKELSTLVKSIHPINSIPLFNGNVQAGTTTARSSKSRRSLAFPTVVVVVTLKPKNEQGEKNLRMRHRNVPIH